MDVDRSQQTSQTLAVPQSTLLTLSTPSDSPALTGRISPFTASSSSPPSVPLSPAAHRHPSRGKHLALLYCPPLSAHLHSATLHKLGYQVLLPTDHSPRAALEAVLAQRVDVVVAEWMDGEGAVLAAEVGAAEAETTAVGGEGGDGGGRDRTAVLVVCEDGASEEERAMVRRECAKAGCLGVMESGVVLMTTLPELLNKTVGDGCWYVDGQSVITKITAVG